MSSRGHQSFKRSLSAQIYHEYLNFIQRKVEEYHCAYLVDVLFVSA